MKLMKNPRATVVQIDKKRAEVMKHLKKNDLFPELPKELAERLMKGDEPNGLELILRYGERIDKGDFVLKMNWIQVRDTPNPYPLTPNP